MKGAREGLSRTPLQWIQIRMLIASDLSGSKWPPTKQSRRRYGNVIKKQWPPSYILDFAKFTFNAFTDINLELVFLTISTEAFAIKTQIELALEGLMHQITRSTSYSSGCVATPLHLMGFDKTLYDTERPSLKVKCRQEDTNLGMLFSKGTYWNGPTFEI